MKKVILSLLLILSVFVAIGCGAKSKGNKADGDGCFTVVYYPGGYGVEWIHKTVKDFLAIEKGVTPEEIKEGVNYKLIADEDITYNASNYLKSKNNCPDLILANGASAAYVSSDLIENLSSVYDTEVDTSNGKVKIKDYIFPEVYGQYCIQRKYGQGTSIPWFMPWSCIPGSIAINETILNKITHYSESGDVSDGIIDPSTNRWIKEPKTVSDLYAYFNDIDIFNMTADTPISKFGWAGKDGASWFEFLICTWWAQIQGLDTPNKYKSEGSFYDFWNFKNPEVYTQSGIVDSLKVIKDLFTSDNGDNGAFINSVNNVEEKTVKEVQYSFAKGEIALCLTGDFFEKEYSEPLNEYGQKIKMMAVPSIDGAFLNDSNDPIELLYLTTTSVMYVPSRSQNKELSKRYLAYLCNEDVLMYFTKETGGIRPFNYNPLEIEPDYEWSYFKKSILDLFYGCDDYVIKYPKGVEDVSPIYIYEDVKTSLFYGVNHLTILSKLRKLSAEDVLINGASGYKSVYQNAKTAFDTWKRTYGLD